MPNRYYEATIQLRPKKIEIDRYIERAFERAGVTLAKKRNLKTGVDYCISSWKFSVTLGNELAKRFGGRITVSRKLFGFVKGKTVYRCTVLYRPHPFEMGDIIASESGVFVVTSLGKGVTGRSLATGRSEKLDLKEDWQKLKKYKAVVSMTSPHLEVISPEDYQSIRVENARKILERRNVKVVMYAGKAYLAG